MSEIEVEHTHTEVVEDDYTMWEVAFWIVGILMIPLVPILMVWLLTPYSGM